MGLLGLERVSFHRQTWAFKRQLQLLLRGGLNGPVGAYRWSPLGVRSKSCTVVRTRALASYSLPCGRRNFCRFGGSRLVVSGSVRGWDNHPKRCTPAWLTVHFDDKVVVVRDALYHR